MVTAYKHLFAFVVFLWGLAIEAQTTYYYRMTKSVENGVTSSNVKGGQFISFNGKVCYESDKKGNQVNESRMEYRYSDNGLDVYSGNSYWGNNTTFFFTTDKNRLSVRTSKGNKYVYERITPPSTAQTCSLIRKKQSDGNYSSQPVLPVIGNSYSSGYNGTNHGDANGSNTSGNGPKPKYTKTCGVCYGTGTCNICAGSGWVRVLGMGKDHNCTSCRNHDGKCSACGGRGTWKE